MMNRNVFIVLFVLILILVGGSVSSATITLESLVPKKDLPEGWSLIHGLQIYTKKTLFERINGQAELFFKYGYQKSVFAIYQNEKNEKNQIEADIYDMGNVLQAFGIFSRFRNEGRPGGFGLDSYLEDHSALFYKGKYFVMLYAAESNPDLLKNFATSIALRITDFSPPPKELGYFPKNDLKPGSIQYFSEGLLGHQFLKRGFQGSYIEKVEVKAKAEEKVKPGDKESKLFLAIYKNSQEAEKALKIYQDDLLKKGKVFSESLIQFGARALKGEDPYQGKVIVLHKGYYLLGAVGFEKEEEGENRLREFTKNIK